MVIKKHKRTNYRYVKDSQKVENTMAKGSELQSESPGFKGDGDGHSNSDNATEDFELIMSESDDSDEDDKNDQKMTRKQRKKLKKEQ